MVTVIFALVYPIALSSISISVSVAYYLSISLSS